MREIHGMSKSPEYEAYKHAKSRCRNSNNDRFVFYGGRGINFLFESFAQFFTELGPRPDGMTLDRIDTNGHYAPGNVRWATQSVQVANRRNYAHKKRRGKGYSWHTGARKWIVQVSYKHKYIYGGLFDNEAAAKSAYEHLIGQLQSANQSSMGNAEQMDVSHPAYSTVN